MPAAVRVRDLTVRYRGGKIALDSVSVEVPERGSLALLGPSGAGKSTLARAMLGLFARGAAVSGSVEFGGMDLAAAPTRELERIRGRRIAMIPQDPAWVFHPQRRVGAQIAECLQVHMEPDPARAAARAREALADVELADARFYESYPHELSGGELQRAALGLALCCGPELLIADEPASALDTVTSARILALLGRLRARRGLALVLVLHDPRLAVGLAEEVAVLDEGRVVESGKVREVLRTPRHGFTQELVECASGLGWR